LQVFQDVYQTAGRLSFGNARDCISCQVFLMPDLLLFSHEAIISEGAYNRETMRKEEKTPDGVSVHTGFPNPATDKRLHTLDFNQLLIAHTASTFMFRVRGNDWEGEGVFDGDIAVVDRALDPRKADVVIWWQETTGEFAISRYAYIPTAANVWGVVTATIHQFRKRSQEK
jgi:hypothetical protein